MLILKIVSKQAICYRSVFVHFILALLREPLADQSLATKPVAVGRLSRTCHLKAVRSGASRKQQDRLLLGAHKNESYVSNLSHVPRREIASTVFATADSDQTLPNQNGGGGQSGPITPNPELDPTQVVQAQLRALRAKDFATVFEFASPDNKQRTGPLAHFCQILEGRAYNVMIGHTTAEVLSSISVSTSRFQQRILIKGSEGNKAIFSWSLSQQEEGPLKGCWMTDAVRRDD
ncbi:hypothetical protein O6H91_03G114200 [Diphasiastrum complanatum]|uniref:Uncharacterized protein n=1 Tax=Diphasiastrum complanatum TaxID=34168 RepID=A0ACC2EAL3_DIPCM|nr:hypothetical protein O6H91_03G114200 [Diphasiastrum complanatum]